MYGLFEEYLYASYSYMYPCALSCSRYCIRIYTVADMHDIIRILNVLSNDASLSAHGFIHVVSVEERSTDPTYDFRTQSIIVT
jgi:hypothetical protein